mgnify:CR=1 FL=1
MKQRVNLYSFKAEQSIWLQYSPFPQAAIGLVVVLMVVTAFSWFDKNKLDGELQTLTQQHNQLNQQLEQLSLLNGEATMNSLQADVASLEAELATRQSTMTSIKEEGAANSQGFSMYLEGLARQHFGGLWLTAIELTQGGGNIGLEGFAGEPEMVPRYVGRLGNEQVFNGTEFDVLEVQRKQGAPVLEFAVTAVTEVER